MGFRFLCCISVVVVGLVGCTSIAVIDTPPASNTSIPVATSRSATNVAVSPVPVTDMAIPKPTSAATSTSAPHQPFPVLPHEKSRLPNVLMRFGIPSQIRFSGYGLTSHSDHFGVYKLLLEYETQQIAIEYSGTTIRDSTGFVACPVFGQVIEPESRSNAYLPELKNMKVQEFYQKFTQPNPAICIRVIDGQAAAFPPDFSSTVYYPEDDTKLVDLLMTKNDCELPCWWGITPGVTSWLEVQQMFLSYGKAVNDFALAALRTGHQVGVFGRHDPNPFDYIVRHTFYEENGVVNYIRVTGEVFESSPSSHFGQDWYQYSLPQILTRLGRPSQVFLNYHQRGCPDTYDLGVAYDMLGVLVEYSGVAQRESGKVIICPKQEATTRINLCLTSPNSGIDLEQEFKSGCWFARSAISLNEATQVNIEEFYSLYSKPDAQACLEALEELGALCP